MLGAGIFPHFTNIYVSYSINYNLRLFPRGPLCDLWNCDDEAAYISFVYCAPDVPDCAVRAYRMLYRLIMCISISREHHCRIRVIFNGIYQLLKCRWFIKCARFHGAGS